MKKLAKYALTTLALLALGLSPAYSQITSNIATIDSASTDGSASSSVFQLSIAADAAATALTTTMNMDIVLSLVPQPSHQGIKADVYTVIVAGGRFFTLDPDGGYSPWNGAVETLTPFVTGHTLSSTNEFTLLDGTLSEAGSYLYFAAYGVEGESRLLFTPNPAQLAVKESTALPGETNSQAAMTFDAEVEDSIVQTRCIACHVEGGLARSSALLFQRTNTASSLNNFGALSAYIDAKGSELFLAKIAGEQGHVGGVQLAKDSSGYASFQKLIAELTDSAEATSYVFSSTSDSPSPRQASFLSEVTLEPREATLRRAALLLQGRLPTDAERKAVVSDATLRAALRNMMQGAAFREFVVTGVNDRLLTQGAQFAISDTMPNFIELHRARVAIQSDEDPKNDFDLYNTVQPSARRASGELFAYIIENEKSYGEILTADYMMMNSVLDKWLGGSAVFASNEGTEVYKPAKIEGFYQTPALKETVKRVNSNSSYEIVGSPLTDYPHTGVLTDFAFLARYPTTATNRNRARARWVLYHFLGIDVEKSSQRPTDEAALTDKNNPTMNNPNCTVCHALLDPVAGAFQNWGEQNFYRPHDTDELDQFYKYPEDRSYSPFKRGDRWYRDMRMPGLFGEEIKEQEKTLRALANLILSESAFTQAAAEFWWSSVFGKPLLDKPAVQSDQGYAAKYAAFSAQQESISKFSATLGQRMNAKDMFVEMLMSPWFSAESTDSYAFNGAQFESQLGNKQLLAPEQLARKTRSLTGVSWRTQRQPSGKISSSYESFGVLLGGIDSDAVTTRATELTPAMTAILMTHATEAACPAVARQFATPISERSLFTYVEEATLPLLVAEAAFDVSSEDKLDLRKSTFSADLTPSKRKLSVKFVNQYCDWTGSECLEQRLLYIVSLALVSPAGVRTEIKANDQRLISTVDANNGNTNCNPQADGSLQCWDGGVSIELDIIESGRFTIEAIMSAQQAPSKQDPVQAAILVEGLGSALESSTPNAVAIKNQISKLFDILHGSDNSPSSNKVAEVYEIFVAAHSRSSSAHNGIFYQCGLWKDGMIFDDFLTQEQLDEFRYVEPGEDWYRDDWRKKEPYESVFRTDTHGSKYAWTAVMMYMLSHYDYLHE